MNTTTTKRPRSAKPFRSRIATSGPIINNSNNYELTWSSICKHANALNNSADGIVNKVIEMHENTSVRNNKPLILN